MMKVINARQFGAKGDGTTDDAAALQAAIDACYDSSVNPLSANRWAKHVLAVPPGDYKINTQLTLRGVKNFTMIGAGGVNAGASVNQQKQTNIFNGAAMDCLFEMDGVADLVMRNILWNGNTNNALAPDKVLYLHWNPNNAVTATTKNYFENVAVGGKWKAAGWLVGGDGDYYDPYQVDQTCFVRCTVRADSAWVPGDTTYQQCGFLVGSGIFANNLIHDFYYCDALGCLYGVSIAATGPVSIFGGIMQNNGWDVNCGNLNGPLYVQGIRSENTKYGFLNRVTPQSVPMPCHVNGIEYHGNLSVIFNAGVANYHTPFWIEANGTTIIENCRVINYANGTKPRIYMNSAKNSSVIVRGLHMQNTRLDELFVSDLATAVAPRGLIEAYTNTDDSVTTKGRWLGPGYWNAKGSVNSGTKIAAGALSSWSVKTNILRKVGAPVAPDAPTATQQGTTGATTYSYKIVAKDASGRRSLPSNTVTVANGNAVLSATNYIQISPTYNAFDFEPVAYDVLKDDAGTWRALYKDHPLTSWYQGVRDYGQAYEDASAYTLPTRDELGDVIVEGAIEHKGDRFGAYGTAPIAKPTIAGSHGGNAASASVAAALAALGLAIDNSTP